MGEPTREYRDSLFKQRWWGGRPDRALCWGTFEMGQKKITWNSAEKRFCVKWGLNPRPYGLVPKTNGLDHSPIHACNAVFAKMLVQIDGPKRGCALAHRAIPVTTPLDSEYKLNSIFHWKNQSDGLECRALWGATVLLSSATSEQLHCSLSLFTVPATPSAQE